ncbi:polysaccharide biosynthesis protein [Aneurinibacillus aneurinilyticus]|jgi:stage V sporulation protein B|uniref:polysaccharide biosynthesis protein n=1 Tax=Aneurinibacillus aneurinilyticus TaxID=1391 RepID=UPI0023F940FA|nr:polysaccharide biosynthesis protein [Aneurinibacillus aneurinilyticus]MCI1694889.1 polysaccharide biosynthesis protein [Aneurinibacillus aneurinilyticus]
MRVSVFFKQLAFRTSAILIVKVIGAFIRIPLFRLLGAEGVGLYQMTYSYYGFLLTFISGGFPTALSFVTAKNQKQGKAFLKMTSVLLMIAGAITGAVSYLFSQDIAIFMGDSQLALPIQYVAPALCIVPLLSLIRGFLQGIEYYGSIAVSEVAEQIVRVSTMLVLTMLWMGYGHGLAVGGAVFGAFTGAASALFFLLCVLRFHVFRQYQAEGNLQAPVLSMLPDALSYMKMSIAILATRLIVPLSEFLDAVIIPHRLQDAGFSASQAISIFGEISGMATTVVYLPTLITAALSHTLAAKIAEDWKRGKQESVFRRIRLAVQLTWMWGIGSGLFLFFYGKTLGMLLFDDPSVGEAIRYFALIPLLTGIREVTTTILWAQDRKKEPMIGLVAGTVCSIVLSYVLVGIPGFGYEGAIISIVSLEVVAMLWNFRIVKKQNKTAFSVFFIVKEGLGMLLIGLCLFQVLHRLVEMYILFLPQYVQAVIEMLVFYTGIALYTIVRFVKVNKMKLFL